ncbi:FAD/NAD(P)-binding domain-containing protein [Dendrothele bispora CBS 962.96]|uniref:FAD/NAD(P)-binding domain-containing protein n=1 Tax=Dendrothele bispora (strain CBS 962.96) TaxID=1314807 RepID=A0A4S8M562_DENBC|nr:FAD/NAD(P)-binding domain-containing protein [Dendrothele bispora CBS 962.96]
MLPSFDFATQAEHTLTLIIIGGSIGGLCTAYWLKKAGHNVIVVEKYSEDMLKDHRFSGVRIPPNSSRLLYLLPGMMEILEEKSSLNLGAVYVQEGAGAVIGKLVFQNEMIADFGSQYYRIPFSHLWTHLYHLCILENIQFKFGFEVQKIHVEPDFVKVTAGSGEELSGDIIVGADGHNSITRNCILADVTGDSEEDSDEDVSTRLPELNQWYSCRLSVPIHEMEKDPDLLPLTRDSLWYLWMGDGIFHTGGREGEDQYAVCIFYPFSKYGKEDREWYEQSSSLLTSEEIENTDCELRVKKLLQLASTCQRTTQKPYKLSKFTDNSNQVILIGDAAHAAVIHGPQNTAIAIEDAFLLGFLFSKINSKHQISLCLNGFNEIKSKRTKMIIASDLENIIGYALAPGHDRDMRNSALGLCSGDNPVTDDVLAHILRGFIDDNNYDMQTVVEEWWYMWGRLM